MIVKKLPRLIELEGKTAQFLAKREELSAEDETRITLFLQGVKGTNSLSLLKVELVPFIRREWPGYRFLHHQFFRELELGILLAKATRWSLNPLVYVRGAILNLDFAGKSKFYRFILGGLSPNRTFVEYLALSHAVMTAISFIRLLPPDRPLVHPFWAAMQEIERNNEVQQQVQVRLLKDRELCKLPVTEGEKEDLVYRYRRIVEEHYANFLELLTRR